MARLVGRTRNSNFWLIVIVAAMLLVVLFLTLWTLLGQSAPIISGSFGV